MALGPYLTLVGLKHVGKSTVARALAGMVKDTEVIDVDDRMVAQARQEGWFPAATPAGPAVRMLYRFLGAEAFASWERETIRRIIDGDQATSQETTPPALHRVIATGGGVCDNTDALVLLERVRPVVYLWNFPENLYRRAVRDGVPAFLDAADPRGSFLALAHRRDRLYRNIADTIVDISDASVEEAANIILEAL
jgi:shikimate kinase